jgi:hypothetical protein
MSEVTLAIIGLIMIYAVIHYISISFSKTWKERSGYEKTITIIGIIIITLIFLNTMFPS